MPQPSGLEGQAGPETPDPSRAGAVGQQKGQGSNPSSAAPGPGDSHPSSVRWGEDRPVP
jgi:hypothetical protein